jgi:hypothetical protein
MIDLFCEHSALFSETWPVSGSMRNGAACGQPALAPATTASASSSSHGLLPTPWASQFNDGESLESWEARNASLRESWSNRKHPNGNGNGMGTPLAIAVKQLMRTPTAQLASNGGSQHPDKRKAGGHGPTLADEVEHLLLTGEASTGQPSAAGKPSLDAPPPGQLNLDEPESG